jgi:aminopeptidase
LSFFPLTVVTQDMKLMRGDMGGAATVVSAALAIAKLKIP